MSVRGRVRYYILVTNYSMSHSSGINLALLSVNVSTNEGKWWHRSVSKIATIMITKGSLEMKPVLRGS